MDPFPEIRVGRDHRAADQVVVTAEELGGAVEHDVGTERQGALQKRRHERVVHDGENPLAPCDPGDPRDVRDLHEGVGGRLEEDRPRFFPDPLRDRPGIAHVDVVERQSAVPEDLLEQPVGSPVQVVGAQDVVAGPEKRHHRGDGRHPGREGDGPRPPFKGGDRLFRRLPRRVFRAGVVEAAVLPERLVPVDGRRVDGGADRPERRIGADSRLRRHGFE